MGNKEAGLLFYFVLTKLAEAALAQGCIICTDVSDPQTGGPAGRHFILTLIVTAGGEVIQKVAEEIVEL